MAFSHEKAVGKSDVWLTPIEIINRLGEFDLDPCGFDGHRTANKMYFSRGLEQEWHGRVWLNPPYSNVLPWLQKLSLHGRGIALVFARTDTKWAQEIMPKADSIFFPSGRIKFYSPYVKQNGSSGSPSMFLSFGEVPNWREVREGIYFKN